MSARRACAPDRACARTLPLPRAPPARSEEDVPPDGEDVAERVDLAGRDGSPRSAEVGTLDEPVC